MKNKELVLGALVAFVVFAFMGLLWLTVIAALLLPALLALINGSAVWLFWYLASPVVIAFVSVLWGAISVWANRV